MKTSSQPLKKAPAAELAKVGIIFFDIDDTFSGGIHGDARILPQAYEALWKLHRVGIATVPVTGRPAGWCDHIARMWPVTAIIGENGAFYCYFDTSKKPARLVKKYLETESIRKKNADSLKKLHKAIQKEFPGSKTPSDQRYREFDLAIDYCEDVARWPDKKVQKLLDFCTKKGAIAKLSSIHVNTWFGKYDKLTCARRVLKDLIALKSDAKVLYVGDSPNDEPFFQPNSFADISVGVANVSMFLDRMKHHPNYIAEQCGGLGFSELADRLLSARGL